MARIYACWTIQITAFIFLQTPHLNNWERLHARLEYPFPFTLPFFNSKPGDEPEKNFTELSYAGTKKIFDEDCDMIRAGRKLKRPDTGEEIITFTTFLISRKDHISRGYETDKQKVWVKMEEYNKAYTFSSFVIAVPQGFGEKKVSAYTPPDMKGLLAPGTAAPIFIPATVTKTPALQNKVVLIDFWGTWCGPCRLAMPHLQSLYKKYKNKGLEVIGISVADAEGAPEKYMKDNKYTYGLFTKGEAVARAYQVNVFPTIYLIGKDGKIIHAEKGIRESFEQDISVLIEKALNPPTP
jgi:thiol-disulfide isomerase/thioredoxin